MEENKKRQSKSLDTMMQNVRDTDASNSTPIKRPNNNIVIILGVIFVVVLVMSFLIIKSLPKEDQHVKRQAKIVEQVDGEQSDNIDMKYLANAPVDLPDWARNHYFEMNEEDVQSMLEYSKGNFIGWTASAMPSEKDGFTADKDKEFLENGLPNMYYTSMTSEAFGKQLSSIVYRITNPIFGGWVDYQHPTHKDMGVDMVKFVYSDISTSKFQKDVLNGTAPRLILADYDKNEYNGDFEIKGGKIEARFIGIVKGGKVIFKEKNQYEVTVDVDYMKNKNEIYKSARLVLNLVSENGVLRIDGGSINEIN